MYSCEPRSNAKTIKILFQLIKMLVLVPLKFDSLTMIKCNFLTQKFERNLRWKDSIFLPFDCLSNQVAQMQKLKSKFLWLQLELVLSITQYSESWVPGKNCRKTGRLRWATWEITKGTNIKNEQQKKMNEMSFNIRALQNIFETIYHSMIWFSSKCDCPLMLSLTKHDLTLLKSSNESLVLYKILLVPP